MAGPQDDDSQNWKREDRALKWGAGIVGGILLLSVFSAVASLATMEKADPEPPAPAFEQPHGMPAPARHF